MFKLSEHFIDGYRNKQPAWTDFSYFIFKRTYSRPIGDGKFEEFWQTLQRVVEGIYQVQKDHCERQKLPWNPQKAQRSAQTMYELMWNFKFLPAGRGLRMMGTDYVKERGSACLHNCCFVSTEEIDTDFAFPFVYLMDMSMLGVGVGSDTKGVGKVSIRRPKYTNNVLVVSDSREGWCELVEVVLNSYVGKALYPKIDYSQIRKEGEPLKSFGGIAAGPGPLMDLISNIDRTLLISEDKESAPITSEQIVDLFNFIGKCVVSGNIRRTAEIMLGDPSDSVFLDLKTDEVKKNDRRWTSNNSVFCSVGMDYSEPIKRTIINGEPGYFWLENARAYGRFKDGPNYIDKNVKGVNPCGEQPLESAETCNLVETFPSNHDTYEEYEKTLKFAYLYAKTVTLIPTHHERTNATILRNSRIGISQSGIQASFAKHGRRQHFEWSDRGYKYLRQMDEIYSNWLCVRPSIKITTVKPSGTVSLLASVPPGIHGEFAEYYIRNVRVAKNSPLVKICLESGYMVEDDLVDKTSVIVSFPIKAKNFLKRDSELTMFEQLENAAQMQYYWADNAISITVYLSKQDKLNLNTALELYETRLKSVSFLPVNEHGYKQAPLIEITKEQYENAVKDLKRLKLKNINLFDVEAEKYCTNDTCAIGG